jgi:hypothetical protein
LCDARETDSAIDAEIHVLVDQLFTCFALLSNFMRDCLVLQRD